MIEVKVQLLDARARVPQYAHSGPFGDIAADLYSIEDVTVPPNQIKDVSTGIALELPAEFGALIEDRSGLASKGITTVGGVIDTGYRGEIRVLIGNLSSEPYQIRAGVRIAQLRIVHRTEA